MFITLVYLYYIYYATPPIALNPNSGSNLNPDYPDDDLMFKICYIMLCVWAILWDLWHSLISYKKTYNSLCPSPYDKILFCLINILISFPLFIAITNLTSSSLPLNKFFPSNHLRDIRPLCAPIIAFIYGLNVVESRYWGSSVEEFIKNESANDIDDNIDYDVI